MSTLKERARRTGRIVLWTTLAPVGLVLVWIAGVIVVRALMGLPPMGP